MELCAAVLLVTTVKQTLAELEYDIDSTYYYTDSKVVLGYIMNESRRFYVYVAYRVELIRSLTSPTSWRYIASESNPADIATRGCSADNLMNTLWLKTPGFLATGGDIPFDSFDFNQEDQEVRDVKACATRIDHKDTSCSLCEYFNYFSSWTRLIKSIARLKILIRQKKSNVSSEVDSHALLEAELVILKHVQPENFANELKILVDQSLNAKRQLRGSRLYNCTTFVHEGLIRVGGRLRQSALSIPEKHPVFLPKKNHVTDLVSLHYHERIHHQGRSITHGAIRQAGFWILGGSDVVNSLIRNCIRCKLLRQPTEAPKMADLPEDRLQQTPPFTNVGMDAFGPWEISTRKTRSGSVNSKRWGIIFTCLYSRAIHIEVVDSMDTSAFINALRRFFAIRGPVSILRSDCGTNFVGARNELKEALKDIENNHVKKFLQERECQWLWNPPSHFGGIWERQIGTLRRVLEGMLLEHGKPQLTHDLLVTLMSEAAAIVNSRPLSAVPSDDSNNPMPLSPANILTMKCRPYATVPGIFDKPDLYCQRRWRRVQYLADQFWLRWRKEYLQNQQPRRKWNRTTQNLAEDDIVLIHDKDAARGLGPKGRIVTVQPSSDGIVRQAEVETCEDDQPGSKQLCIRRKRFLRPTTELVFLFRPGN